MVHHRNKHDSKNEPLEEFVDMWSKFSDIRNGLIERDFHVQAWELLGQKFGRPYLIVDAQLNTLSKQQPIRMHDSTAMIIYIKTISNQVKVLKQYIYESNLRPSFTLQVAMWPDFILL